MPSPHDTRSPTSAPSDARRWPADIGFLPGDFHLTAVQYLDALPDDPSRSDVAVLLGITPASSYFRYFDDSSVTYDRMSRWVEAFNAYMASQGMVHRMSLVIADEPYFEVSA